MYKKIIIALTVIGAFALQNCKPDGGDPEPTPITAPEITLPLSIPSVDGILVATNIDTKNGGTELIVGTAHAMFYKGKNPTLKVEAGTVKINSKDATKSDDNIYFFAPSITEPTGLVYQNQIYWKTSGNTANDVPVIDNNDGTAMPSIPSIGEFYAMNTFQDKLISWANSSGSDSVILIIKGPSATYKRVFNNTITSHTVPKAEIVKLGLTANGSLQVINYIMQVKAVGTKNYAFIKQSIGLCTKVTITN